MRPAGDVVPTVSALAEQGYTGADIDFALPTYAHWDHACGFLDLPGLPVYLHRTEHDWVTTGSVAPIGGLRDSLDGRTTIDYDLDGPPILTITRSHDLFGDGSVVLVDLAGHTPGSVGVLLHTSAGHVLLAGDAAWHTYQVDDIRQKVELPRRTRRRRPSGEFSDPAPTARDQGPCDGSTNARSRRCKTVARRSDCAP